MADDETALTNSIGAVSTAMNNLKMSEAQLRSTVDAAKVQVATAQKAQAAAVQAKAQADGAMAATKKMMNESAAEFRQSQEVWSDTNTNCTGKTATGKNCAAAHVATTILRLEVQA